MVERPQRVVRKSVVVILDVIEIDRGVIASRTPSYSSGTSALSSCPMQPIHTPLPSVTAGSSAATRPPGLRVAVSPTSGEATGSRLASTRSRLETTGDGREARRAWAPPVGRRSTMVMWTPSASTTFVVLRWMIRPFVCAAGAGAQGPSQSGGTATPNVAITLRTLAGNSPRANKNLHALQVSPGSINPFVL